MSASEAGGDEGGSAGVGHSYDDIGERGAASGCELDERIFVLRCVAPACVIAADSSSTLRNGGLECSVSGTGAEDERR